MTEVTFAFRSPFWTISFHGHAGYAEHGRDIVCSCLSLMASTIAEIVEADDEIDVVRSIMEDGNAEFLFSTYRSDTADIKVRTILKQAQMLAESYPMYVALTMSV